MSDEEDVVITIDHPECIETQRIVKLSDKHPINPGGTTLIRSYEPKKKKGKG
jgi:hypothetical protein